jgi:hypothetical protein
MVSLPVAPLSPSSRACEVCGCERGPGRSPKSSETRTVPMTLLASLTSMLLVVPLAQPAR